MKDTYAHIKNVIWQLGKSHIPEKLLDLPKEKLKSSRSLEEQFEKHVNESMTSSGRDLLFSAEDLQLRFPSFLSRVEGKKKKKSCTVHR